MTNADDINMTRGAELGAWSSAQANFSEGYPEVEPSSRGMNRQHQSTGAGSSDFKIHDLGFELCSYACHVIKVIFNYIYIIYIYFIDIHNLY